MARTEVTGSQIKDQSVSLTVDVAGILPVANGGTGSTTFALNSVLLGNGTGALQAVAPGTSGNVLTSNGTTWISAPASGEVTLAGTETLTNKTLTSPRINQILDTGGNVAVSIPASASAVNYLNLVNAAAGDSVQLSTSGSDANINILLRPKGTGFVSITNSGAANLAQFRSATTPVNYWQFHSASTGAAIKAYASGTDANVSIDLIPQGTGTVKANGVDVVTTTGAQTLTNKTLTTPVISGTPTSALADTVRNTVGSKFIAGIPLVFDTLSYTGGGSVVGLHNELAYLVARGGSVTVTKNGSDVTGTFGDVFDYSSSAVPSLAVDATTDQVVITITVPVANGSYAHYWGSGQVGINFRAGFSARDVKFESESNSVWSTFYDVIDDGELVHYKTYSAGSPYVSRFRITLTDFVTTGATGLRIENIWATSASGSPARHSILGYLPRGGGPIYGTTAVPPTFTATGSDANIGINLVAKGTGTVQAGGVPVATTTGTQTLTNKTLSGATSITGDLTVDNGTSSLVTIRSDDTGTSGLLLRGESQGTSFVEVTQDGSYGGGMSFYGGGGSAFAAGEVADRVTFYRKSAGARTAVFYYSHGDSNVVFNGDVSASGAITSGGVAVPTISSTSTLTNKTISGASNTLSNIPASATPDAARLVTTVVGGGTGHWAKLATFTPGSNAYFQSSLTLKLVAYGSDSACDISVHMGNGAAGVDPYAAVSMSSRSPGTVFADDSFKVVSGAYGTPLELWVKCNSAVLSAYETAKYVNYGTLTYTTSPVASQASEPVGAVNNVRSAGVAIGGVPVVTTTGTQTLTNKTLTTPIIASIHGVNNTKAMEFSADAGAVNYFRVSGKPTGNPVYTQADGADADISLYVSGKGTGKVILSNAGGIGFSVTSATSSVNRVEASGAATGVAPTLSALGTDANISINLVPKGTGVVQVGGVDVVTTTGTQTLTNKTVTSPRVNQVLTTGGSAVLSFANYAGTANYFHMESQNAGGGGPRLNAAGSDANVPIHLLPKGTGQLYLHYTTAGATPTIEVLHADANANLNLVPKGTGTVKAGGVDVELTSRKAVANGYASLDSNGKVPGAQLPNSIMTYQGLHNASTNSPALTDAGGAAGQVYRISVAGTRNYGAGNIELAVGDYLIHNGTSWEKADTTDAVSTVNGYTGNVSLTKSDVGLGNVDNTSDTTKNSATATLTNKTISGASNTLSNIPVSALSASGTPSVANFLRGDGSWATVATGTGSYTTSVGNGSLTSFTITHNLNSRSVSVSVWDSSTYEEVEVDIVRSTVNTVTLTFSSAPTTDAYQVLVMGGQPTIASGYTREIVSVTGSTTLAAVANTDYVAIVGSGGAPTLPTAVGNTNRYTLKNAGTTNRTVATTGGQTIDGSTTAVLTPNTSIDVISDGTNWRVI